MINKVLDLAQVPIALFFVFLDYNGIDSNGWGIRKLTFYILAQIRTFFSD